MVSPPVHRPSDPDYHRRVGWGLALVGFGTVAPLLYAAAAGTSLLWTPSLFCAAVGCPTLLQWGTYVLAILLTLGVTAWWWAGVGRRRALVTAQLTAMAALVGWAVVVPFNPLGWLCLVAGGLLTAAGTGGLLDQRSHDRAPAVARLARLGGVSVSLGFLGATLLGYWPLVVAPAFLAALVAHLWLSAAPLGWLRLHALWFVAALLVAVPPWTYVDPGSIGATDVVPPPSSLPPPPQAGSPVYLADEVVSVFVLVGVAGIAAAVLAEVVLSCGPVSPAARSTPGETD